MSITLQSNGTSGYQDWKYRGNGLVGYRDQPAIGYEYIWLPMPDSSASDEVGAYINRMSLRIEDASRIVNPVARGAALDQAMEIFITDSYIYNAYEMCGFADSDSGNLYIVYQDGPQSYDTARFVGGLRMYDPVSGLTSAFDVIDGYTLQNQYATNLGLPVFDTMQECIDYLIEDHPDPGDDPGTSGGGSSTITPSHTFDDINVSILESLTVLAEMDEQNLGYIGAALNNRIDVSQDISDNIMKLARGIIQGNITEGIIGVKLIPIPSNGGLPYKVMPDGQLETLFDPMGSHNVAGKKLNKYIAKYTIGSMYIEPIFGDYRDYLTEYSIYLPYSGIHRLDADIIVGNTLLIDVDIDFLCGAALYHIAINDGENMRDIYQFTGDCAIEVPITAKDYTGKYSAIMNGIFNGVGNAASGALLGPAGAVAGAASSALQTVGNVANARGSYIQSGKLVPNACALSVTQPYLIISKPQDATPDIASTKGRPCHKVKNLSSCSGFTMISNICLDNIPYATDEDKAELKTLLANGVYF